MEANLKNEYKYYQDKIEEYREKLISSVTDSIYDYDSFFENISKLNDYLEIGRWLSDSPRVLEKWTNDRYERGSIIDFSTIILEIQDEEDSSNEEIYDKYIIPTLEYIRIHKICSIQYDW